MVSQHLIDYVIIPKVHQSDTHFPLRMRRLRVPFMECVYKHARFHKLLFDSNVSSAFVHAAFNGRASNFARSDLTSIHPVSKMPLLLKLFSIDPKEAISSPRAPPMVLSEIPNQPLEFWYIRPHDRGTLIDHIMPYMAEPLPRKHSLQTILDRHAWAEELVKSEVRDAIGDSSACLSQSRAAFWLNPTTMTQDLLALTRLWFFMLLRYTYRKRFFEGRRSSQSELIVRDLCAHRDSHYLSELSDNSFHCLTRLEKKYGASFYRSSRKDTKQRLAWTSFCERIRTFCKSLGLHTSSNNPEKNLRELRHNLTPIVLHQKWLYVNDQLAEHTSLVCNLRADAQTMDERVMRNIAMIESMKREIQGLVEPRQRDVEIGRKFEDLARDVQQSDENSMRLIHSLQSGLKELRNGLGLYLSNEENNITADGLILCRWLLEHLPSANPRQERLGYHWRQFWQYQWDQCRKNMKRQGHPLWKLVSDEKYNKVGRNLYGTLSHRLHRYGHQRGDKLHPDVQRILEVIRPVHYDTTGVIDLEAERKRWFQ